MYIISAIAYIMYMSRNTVTNEVTDRLLMAIAAGGVVSLTLLAPNAMRAFDKPLKRYFKRFEERQADREYQRLIRNMKRQGLIKRTADDYEHGIQLTRKGKQRAQKAVIEQLAITSQERWDHKWRIVFYDIPEQHKAARDHLTRKIKTLGFWQLQRSVWIHPYPCLEEISVVAEAFGVSKYVTYIETSYIDAEDRLISRFPYLSGS